tara:strand:+ start:2903 stop:3514 length:612 start_codon:yes stop_codon:yes gene_type:complete
MYWIFILINCSLIFGQPKYPIDTLFKSNKVSTVRKLSLLPIAAWQRISYNSNLLNCQFYPSCSNYGSHAIKNHGLITGAAITSDRIVRCNPFALYYHTKLGKPFHANDGRLIDYLNPKLTNQKEKSPRIAASLSMILPGSGRVYSNHFWDGLMGFWTFYMSATTTYYSIKKNRPVAGPVFGFMTISVYLGEIYGAWRSAKYYR